MVKTSRLRHFGLRVCGPAVAAAVLVWNLAAQSMPPRIPLCEGLTIVTAISQTDGDYESIKTILSVTDAAVRLRYSNERMVSDMLSSDPPKLVSTQLFRSVRRADLQAATLYEQQFSDELPEQIPETTAIGTSAAVLKDLKTKGEAKFGIFIAYSQKKPSLDRNTHPNVYDNQMVAAITRVEMTPVMLPVLVDDVPATLPAIHAAGDFFGDKSEFYFLDDATNPLTLRFRVGINHTREITEEESKRTGLPAHPAQDRESLQVIKITTRCAGGPPEGAGSAGGSPRGGGQIPNPSGGGAGGGGAAGGGSGIERALAESGRVDVYSIYFTFNSDVIREESEPTLKEIADVLRRHPDWKLGVNGHTDGVGADQYNLDLSRRRAAAVRTALVTKYGIPADRLAPAGFGKSQPRDTNATLEGRARNRRVELIKQ